jgi:predicted nucleic-acid-binding protein
MARAHGRLEIGEAVLGESCWVLERKYGMSRREVAMVVRDVLGSRDFVAWDPELADRALARMHSSSRFALVDCLLLERAVAGESVLTFDRDLARAIERS